MISDRIHYRPVDELIDDETGLELDEIRDFDGEKVESGRAGSWIKIKDHLRWVDWFWSLLSRLHYIEESKPRSRTLAPLQHVISLPMLSGIKGVTAESRSTQGWVGLILFFSPIFRANTWTYGMAIFMMLLAIAGIIVGVLTSSHSEPHSAVVDLGYARYQGRSLYNDVDEYLGMRFAKPPLDDLRFRAPEDPESSSDVQDASAVRLFLQTLFLSSPWLLHNLLTST